MSTVTINKTPCTHFAHKNLVEPPKIDFFFFFFFLHIAKVEKLAYQSAMETDLMNECIKRMRRKPQMCVEQ